MRRSLSALWLGTTLLTAAPAGATPITLSFTGTIREVESPLESEFLLGAPASGSFQFPDLDTDPDPNIALYVPVGNASFDLFTYTATSPDEPPFGGDFLVLNDPEGDVVFGEGGLSGAAVDGYTPFVFEFNLEDDDGSALASDALPVDVPLSEWDVHEIDFIFTPEDPGQPWVSVHVTVTSIAFRIPEPTAMAWIAALTGALSCRRRRAA
jgi:hypothetical protein